MNLHVKIHVPITGIMFIFATRPFHLIPFREFCMVAHVENLVMFNSFILFLSMVNSLFT